MAEAAAPVQLGLTLSPLDGTLQPFTEEALEQVGRGKKQQQQDGGGTGGHGWEWTGSGQKYFRDTKDGGVKVRHVMEQEETKSEEGGRG